MLRPFPGRVSPLDRCLDAFRPVVSPPAAWVGSDLSRPQPGLGHDRLRIAGTLTLDGTGAAFLRGAEIVMDANQLKGDLDLLPGDARPLLKGTLVAGPIVLATGPEGEMGGGQVHGRQV